MIDTDLELVLFVGAGFSVPFGLPTMNRFLDFVAASRRVGGEQKQFLLELVLEARRANAFLESSPTNLEDILSFAVMSDRLGVGEAGRTTRIRSLLSCALSDPSDNPDYWGRFAALQSFLGVNDDRDIPNLDIVTTNYDVSVESCLFAMNRKAGSPFRSTAAVPPVEATVVDRLYVQGGVPVFKLHGSITWIPTDEGLAVDSRVVENSVPGILTPRTIPAVCLSPITDNRPPVIVPPSFLKPEFTRELQDVWSGAARAMSKARAIVFLGYSFPPSDVEMAYFLAASLSENARLSKVVVVDPDAERIVKRLRGSSSRFGSHLKALLEPVGVPWEHVVLEAII